MIPESYTAMGVDPGDRKPVFAVLRIGKKDPERGHPIDKGNFYVVSPQVQQVKFGASGGRQYSAPMRPESPDFAEYNGRDKRTTFRGILPYPQLEQCWDVRRRAATIEGFPQHPDKILTCECRDGETAERAVESLRGRSA